MVGDPHKGRVIPNWLVAVGTIVIAAIAVVAYFFPPSTEAPTVPPPPVKSDSGEGPLQPVLPRPVVDVASLSETFAHTVERSIKSTLSRGRCQFERIALLDFVETVSTRDGLHGVIIAVTLNIERADAPQQVDRVEANGFDTSPDAAASKARAELLKKIISRLDAASASCE